MEENKTKVRNDLKSKSFLFTNDKIHGIMKDDKEKVGAISPIMC